MAGLKKNKDLDLRRYGKNLYTKALQSGGNGGSEGGEGTVDLEGIYQFYKQLLFSTLPPDIENPIIPEHFEDIIELYGTEYEPGTIGIWSTDNFDPIGAGDVDILFTVPSDETTIYIVIGEYGYLNDSPLG